MPLESRNVVYCPRKGVLLGVHNGKIVWSKDREAVAVETAPTFESVQDFKEKMTNWFDEADWEELDREVQLREIFPTRGEFATMQDCIDILLPRWDGK